MVERSIGSGKNILNDFGFKVFCLISFSEKKEGVNVSSAEKYTKRSSVLQTTALGILFCGTDVMSFSSWKRRLSKLVINPLDGRNTEKPKTKMLSFYQQQSYFSQIVSEKAKILTSFFMKKSKNNNIILGFSFTYLVLVYPMDSTLVTKH